MYRSGTGCEHICLSISLARSLAASMPLYDFRCDICGTLENYFITLYGDCASVERKYLSTLHTIVVGKKFKSIFSPFMFAFANKDIFYFFLRLLHKTKIPLHSAQRLFGGRQRNAIQNFAQQYSRRTTSVASWICTFVPSLTICTIDIRYSNHTTANSTQLQRAHNCEIYSMGFFFRCSPLPLRCVAKGAHTHTPFMGPIDFNRNDPI